MLSVLHTNSMRGLEWSYLWHYSTLFSRTKSSRLAVQPASHTTPSNLQQRLRSSPPWRTVQVSKDPTPLIPRCTVAMLTSVLYVLLFDTNFPALIINSIMLVFRCCNLRHKSICAHLWRPKVDLSSCSWSWRKEAHLSGRKDGLLPAARSCVDRQLRHSSVRGSV